jgi:hypothetical protein
VIFTRERREILLASGHFGIQASEAMTLAVVLPRSTESRAFFSSILFSVVLILNLQSAILDQWHWRNPLPQGNQLNNVVFANGNYISVGEWGTILTSTDGTNWVRRESGTTDTLRDCAYGAGRYVVVGDFGTVLSSTDLVTWTWHYAGTFYSLNGITFAAGQFIAVGEQTTIVTSVDGANWTQRASGEWELFDVIHANGQFVAVGGTPGSIGISGRGVILTSVDGTAWTRRPVISGDPIVSVAYGAGQFTAVERSFGYSFIWTSSDGITWASRLAPLVGWINAIAYGQGAWTIGSGLYPYTTQVGEILVSSNLNDWSTVVSNSSAIGGITYSASKFVAARADGALEISTNGFVWNNPAGEILPFALYELRYINGSFWGMAGDRIVRSSEGVSWSASMLPTNTARLVSITYGNGRYVAGSDSHTLWVSLDGEYWTNATPDPTNIQPQDVHVAYGNGVFVGVSGYLADVFTSTNGLDWSVQQLQTNLDAVYFTDVAYGNGRFVAVAQNGIACSSDGINWSLTSPDIGLSRVTFGNGVFVAIGYSFSLVSADGTNWIRSDAFSFVQYANDVAYGDGLFIAVGGVGNSQGLPYESPIWISTDGLGWTIRSSKTSRILYTAAFGNGTFAVTGGGSAILQSDPLVNLRMGMQSPPQLFLSGPTNRFYRIEYTDGLRLSNSWEELTSLVPTESPSQFNDSTWTNAPSRFYRAVLLP